MQINEGRKAHDHALIALSHLLNEPWSFEVLGLVRYELGQAYFMLNRHLKKGKCPCGDKPEDLELYKSVLTDVNTAITNATLSPIPLVIDELTSYFSEKKSSHNCISFTLKKHAMTHDL
ncbi:hypothetical protein [Mesobacillus harenae]|uniref:hypothetical protein n=1 Tax=Mesobacillus harenae TaxID=2213203 RepID=UPI0015809FDC|nr:hypothetical protein [Mesobacillus harenae]